MARTTATGAHADATDSFSEVVILGRLGTRVEQRTLPSGDAVTMFTVIVDRPPRERGPGHSVLVDAIACQTFRPALGRRIEALAPGEWVRVEGALRRRFWRAGPGLASAMDVDVRRLERVRMRP